jgi:hypothetical protein
MTIASRLRRYRRVIVWVLLTVGGLVVLGALGAMVRRRSPVRPGSLFDRHLNRLVHQPSEDVDATDLDAGGPGTVAPDWVPHPDTAAVAAEAGPDLATDRAEYEPMPGWARPHLWLVGEARGAASSSHPADEPDAVGDAAFVVSAAHDGEAHRPRRGLRSRGPLVVGAALVVAVLGIATLLAVGGSDGDDDSAAADGSDTDRGAPSSSVTTGPAVDALVPADVLATVADHLDEAGGFRYTGTTAAADVSAVRPGPWLAVELDVTGDVDLRTAEVDEIATSTSGEVVETDVEGLTVRGRTASDAASLEDADYVPEYQFEPVGGPRLGLTQLPTWLRTTVGAVDVPRDLAGRRVIQATVPASVLGPVVGGQAPVDASLLISVDAAGNPVHLELATAGDVPALRLSLDIHPQTSRGTES